jgi:hypothetical protein
MPAFAGFFVFETEWAFRPATLDGMKIAQFFIKHNFLNTQRIGWRRS